MVKKQFKEIYSAGVASMFLSSFFAMFLGIGSYMMYNKSHNDTYIATIIGAIISFGLFFIFNYIFSNNSEENIYKLNKKLFGKFFSTILNLLLFLAFLAISCVVLYNISNFFNIEYLPDGNINLLKALILVAIIYICSKSLPEIIKVNQVFSIVSIIVLIVDILGLYSEFDINNLEPVLGTSKLGIFESIVLYVVLSIVPFTILLTTSKNKLSDDNRWGKTIAKVMILTNVMQIVIVTITILILGKDYINCFRFPEYTALKQFTLFNMIERIENLLSLQIFFNSFSLLSFLFNLMIKFLPNINLKKCYSVVIAIIIYFLTSIFFNDSIGFINILNKFLIYVILIGMLVPVLFTFFKMLIDKKRQINV